jgi:Tfp pilus assembly protein PilV
MKSLLALLALLALTVSGFSQAGSPRPYTVTAYAAAGTLANTTTISASTDVTNVTFYPAPAGNVFTFNVTSMTTNAAVTGFAFNTCSDGTNYTTHTNLAVLVTNSLTIGSNAITFNVTAAQLGNAPLAKLSRIYQSTGNGTYTNGILTLTQYR